MSTFVKRTINGHQIVCLLPAHIMCEDVHATHHLHCQWWAGQGYAKHAENAASVHNTWLDKIACYLQRICKLAYANANLGQLGVFKNQCMLHFRLHFLPAMSILELLTFARECSNTLKVWWEVLCGFCWKYTSPNNNERILKIQYWHSYRQEFGVLLFWDTVYNWLQYNNM